MESIAHDFFCFMSKLLWPLFIYYLTVPHQSWWEDQFAVLSLLLLKDTFASWTWPLPVSMPGLNPYLCISKNTLIFTICNTSLLCWHFIHQHTTLMPSILSFILIFQSSKNIKSQKFWGTGEAGQHGGTQLGLSQGGHLIQTPLSHKGGTHKLTHLIESFYTKECF